MLAAALVLSLLAITLPAGSVMAGTLERQSGANRYATAAEVSRNSYPEPTAPTVYVATGENYADALAAGPATHGDGPVLLVRTNTIPSETHAELQRLKPGKIVIAGGTSVVSSAVQTALGGYGAPVSRHFGPNRFATAAAISRNAFANPSVPVVYISTGANFADALAAGAATRGRGPVLLVNQFQIPPETHTELQRLNPGKIIIAGGTAVISSSVGSQLAGYGAPVVRQSGANRYATAAQISKGTFVDPNVSVVYVATGEGFADALAAGPGAIRGAGPVMLVRRDQIPAESHAELQRLNPNRIVVVGGTSVVSAAVESQLAQYLTPTAATVADTFSRTVTSGWGTSETGGTWSRTIGPVDAFSVTGGYGRVIHPVAGSTRQLEIRPVASSVDQEILMRVQVLGIPSSSHGDDLHVHAIARRVSGVDFYRLQVGFNGAGHISLLPQKVVNRTPTGIGAQINTALASWTAGNTYWVKFQVLGTSPTTLRGKVWQAGNTEPGGWAFSRTDSQAVLQQAASSVAFRSFLVAGYSATLPVEVRVHEFRSEPAP
jgi:putative cell wall-binding protein